jgi:UDP-glucose 4-epimerase
MSLDESVELVLFALENGSHGEIFVQKAPASTIDTLAKALIEITNSNSKIKCIGTRHGEKLFESLISSEEMSKVEDLGNYYKVPMDGRNLNYSKYVEVGKNLDDNIESYTSHNTLRLDVEETKGKLMKLDIIQDFIK